MNIDRSTHCLGLRLHLSALHAAVVRSLHACGCFCGVFWIQSATMTETAAFSVEDRLRKARRRYKTHVVEKEDELDYDLGNLCAVDPAPLDPVAYKYVTGKCRNQGSVGFGGECRALSTWFVSAQCSQCG